MCPFREIGGPSRFIEDFHGPSWFSTYFARPKSNKTAVARHDWQYGVGGQLGVRSDAILALP